MEEKWQRLPGFPLSATLSAATALPYNKQETSLAVRGNQELVPEPGPDAGRVGQIMRFGFPGLDNIRSHSDYVLSYDRRNRVPHWVFEHLTRHNILITFLIISNNNFHCEIQKVEYPTIYRDSVQKTEGVDRAESKFEEDTSQHPFFRSKNSDYKYRCSASSQFSDPYLVPSVALTEGTWRRQGTTGRTRPCATRPSSSPTWRLRWNIFLCNLVPARCQVGKGFNRDKWEHLERYVRKLTKLYRYIGHDVRSYVQCGYNGLAKF